MMNKTTIYEITGWEFIGYEVTATTKEGKYAWSIHVKTEERALTEAVKAIAEGYRARIIKELYANITSERSDTNQ